MRLAMAGLVLLLLATSCLKPRPWPIPQLTVSGGADPAPIPRIMVGPEMQPFLSDDGSQLKEGPNVYSWMRGFNYLTGWDALVRHVEAALLPLGYQPYSGNVVGAIPDVPGVPKGTIARAWKAPDGMYLVALVNVAFIKDRDNGEIADTDANFVLVIDQLKDLPAKLQQQVDAY